MAVRLVDAITLRLVEREIEELVVYVGPNKVAESLGLWLGRPVGRGLPWRVNRRSFHTYTRCGHALQRGHEASYRTRGRVRISRHGSCCVGGKQLGQRDFEQEGQDIVPPNVSTSPQDVHLSLGEGQGLGSS